MCLTQLEKVGKCEFSNHLIGFCALLSKIQIKAFHSTLVVICDRQLPLE